MSNTSSTDTELVEMMRWLARGLTVFWALPVIYWTSWLVFYGVSIVQIVTLIILFHLFLIAALIASALRKDAIGGRVN